MKLLEFIRKYPLTLITINIPVLILLTEYFKFSESSELLVILVGSFFLMTFERFLLDAFRPKTKSKSIEELIDESWAQYRKEKQMEGIKNE